MSEMFVYTSSSLEVMEVWRGFDRDRRAFRDKLDVIEADTGFRPIVFAPFVTVAGLKPKRDVDPPTGWRPLKDDDFGMLVPDMRTKAGKQWAARLSATCGPMPCAVPGCPPFLARDGVYWHPSIIIGSGHTLAVWGIDADKGMGPQWKRRCQSEIEEILGV